MRHQKIKDIKNKCNYIPISCRMKIHAVNKDIRKWEKIINHFKIGDTENAVKNIKDTCFLCTLFLKDERVIRSGCDECLVKVNGYCGKEDSIWGIISQIVFKEKYSNEEIEELKIQSDKMLKLLNRYKEYVRELETSYGSKR